MKKKYSRALNLIGLALSAVSIWYLIHSVKLDVIINNLNNIEYIFAVPVLISFFCAYVINALRWKMLQTDSISFKNAWNATIINYGVNVLLPARMGDLAKLAYMKRFSGVPASHALVWLFFERAVDIFIIILAGSAATLISYPSAGKEYIRTLIILPLAAVIAVLIFILARQRISSLIERLQSIRHIPRTIISFISNFSTALNQMSSRKVVNCIGISILYWFLIVYLGYYFSMRMLGIQLSYAGSIFVICSAGLAYSVPSAPSGLGIFHLAVLTALRILDVPPEQGILAATFIHLITTIPVAVYAVLLYIFKITADGRRLDDYGLER